MCGIAGIINKKGDSPKLADIKKMTDAVVHRGPDGEGHFIDSNIAFGHRRLAIIDLSSAGHQPMEMDNLVITYNGEIYNYLEIKDELRQRGCVFTTKTDTEVILKAYEYWGEGCVNKFNGMWSFALLDKVRGKIFISRDRFGIKPFYYFENKEVFLLSSEIRQILTQIQEPSVNKQTLFDYLYLGYHHHSDETFFKNINSLPPGHNLSYDIGKNTFCIKKYYELTINEDFTSLNFEGAEKLFQKTIDKAIALRLRSDVRVGTCLSGGMDSSYIAATAAEEYHKSSTDKFTAFTAKSIEKRNDESHFAKMVVDAFQLDWKVTQPSKEDFLEVAEEVIETQEEPFGSPSIIMAYFVMKKAKEEGCTVLLDGQGGDESLLGYDRYYPAYINQQKNIFQKIKSAVQISRNSKLSLKDVMLYNIYFNNASVRAFRQLRRHNYIKREFTFFINKKLLQDVAYANKDIHRLQKFELTKVQLQKLLKFEDRNSMKFSIETRVPFVDYNVVELAYSLPFSYKMRKGWSKYILRKSAENRLPGEIVWRKNKFGFEAPTKKWLSDKESFLKEIKSSSFLERFVQKDRLNKGIDDITLWKLYNIAVWARKFDIRFD
ncbi:asparagine synthase (glutamine-hydrolyzing) [Flagellimonas marinaquae]|uniref:asparagine synthase (glutamine-hydrolyzing) n=1 Tax=Flagellimonas marinaquae TaxID=254955 RepID=UPI002074B221|nr:asparagine synthase (glutamine-hydrolyzing) [Allomuricauda aquimarina]USD26664.1 asparagine synthase (glutamine-hydrolyzing) [Allomuricauda aquimarina]